MKKLGIIGAALGFLVTLVGCSGAVSEKPTENGLYVDNGYGAGSVTVVEVPHGDTAVTCAVLIGYNKGGISCDWAGAVDRP